MSERDAQHWKAAMEHELQMIDEMNTWQPTILPNGKTAIPTKWVFNRKRDKDGNVTRFRARLVVKGFSQVPGVDYDDVFAPVARYSTFRFMFAFSIQRGFSMMQLDVKNAFLNGKLLEKIYVKPPRDVHINPRDGYCMLLNKALYGLKQAARVWYFELEKCVFAIGFSKSTTDPSLYIRKSNQSEIYLLVYVDDVLLMGANDDQLKSVSNKISARFDARLETTVSKFLGMTCERCEGEAILHSELAVRRIIKHYNMSECRPARTPLPSGFIHDQPDSKDSSVKASTFPYRELVGSLLYLASTTRLDIAYATSLL